MFILFRAPALGFRWSASRYLLRLLCCLLIGSQTTLVQAAPANQTLTLSTALDRAMNKNPSLRVFDFRNAALDGQLAKANLTPAFGISLEAENFAGSDELNDFDGAEISVSLSSVLEMGDKRKARRGMVTGSRSLLDAQRQVAALELLAELTRRYVEVLAAQHQLGLAKETNELARQTLAIVSTRAEAGATPEAEVKRAQAETSQAQLTLLASQQQLDYLKVSLAALWGERTANFATVDGDLFQFGKDIAFTTLYTRVENNPAIQLLAARQRLNDAELRLAKTQSRADISWSVGVRRFQESDNAALLAGVSMPLFSSKRNTGAVSAAQARRHVTAAEKDILLLTMHTQLYRAFHYRQQAIFAVSELQNNIIPALQEALSATQQAYQQGRYSYREYASAKQELLSAQRSLIETATAALNYATEIEQLTAEPLSASQYRQSAHFSGSNQ
jgi:cobalt-zinc-cadmium efflux system outer membrane protein